jgi:hypothetical protein
MTQVHQPGQSVFRSVLPERYRLEAVPSVPAVSPAGGCRGRAEPAGTLCDQSQNAFGREADAA